MSAQATHRMCWTLWDPRTAEAGSGRRHRNRNYSDSEKLCDEPQSALGVPMRKMASNLGCRSMKKAVGALREGVAFVPHGAGRCGPPWGGVSTANSWAYHRGCTPGRVCLEITVRESQVEDGAGRGESRALSGCPSESRLKCTVSWGET